MASSLNKKHRKQCKAMSEKQLRDTIRVEEPRVKILSSLVECAKWELRKRLTRQERLLEEEESED